MFPLPRSGEGGQGVRVSTRRDFVQTSAAALAAAVLPASIRRSAGPPVHPEKLDRIGVQLYTVRDLIRQDFEGTLAKVADVGFQEVEFALRYFDHTPAQVRNILTQHGLTSPSAHLPFESLGDGWQAVLDDAQEIGHEYVLIASTPQLPKTLDDWKRIAEKFNRAGEATVHEGLKFAYHNHDFEFKPVEGRIPFDFLLENTDPSLVKIEMDLYWITLGGGQPLLYFDRYPGRFPMVHVKDLKRGAAKPMVDVGAGDIDWKAIFAQHAKAGIEHYYVEHDEPADPIASIRASYQYLRGLEF